MDKVNPNGSIEVAVSAVIAIFTEGTAKIYYRQIAGNTPPVFYLSSIVNNEEVKLTPGSTVDTVRIDAGPDSVVYYEAGAAPTIDLKTGDSIVGAVDPAVYKGKTAATAAGSSGGDIDVEGADAAAGTATTAGGVGGDADLTGGVGGAKATAGSADGGAGGAASVTAGVGGATASTASDTAGAGGVATVTAGAGGAASAASVGGAGGATSVIAGAGGATAGAGTDNAGAGGDNNVTAGVGGEATAGTGDGGKGGDVILTPGAAGASAGGTAGVSGVLIDRGVKLVNQGTPAAKTVSATLTVAELLTGLITLDQGAAGATAQQLPTAANLDIALPSAAAEDAFDFSVVNISTNGAEDGTITTNTGWTLVGNIAIVSNAATTDISFARFRARKTAAGAWTLYRIA